MRKIEFDLNGAKATAVMLDEVVPKTCDIIWNRLPLEGMAIHAKWAGREFMLHLGGENRILLEPETPNKKAKIPYGLGTISYFYREAGVLRGVQREYSPEFQKGLIEFAIYYGDRAPSMQDPGRKPPAGKQFSNLFAIFEEPIPDDFVAQADSLNYEGLKPLVVRQKLGGKK